MKGRWCRNKIERIRKEITPFFADDYSGHDLQHTLRVCRMAAEIAEKEKADVCIAAAIALLHDVDDEKLIGKQGKPENAAAILRKVGADEETAKQICRNIEKISFRGSGDQIPPDMEGKIVQDADRLDAIGAVGIARTFAYAGNRKQPLFSVEDETGGNTALSHFYDKLLKLKKLLNTETARRMAEERHDFMLMFLDELYRETGYKKDGSHIYYEG